MVTRVEGLFCHLPVAGKLAEGEFLNPAAADAHVDGREQRWYENGSYLVQFKDQQLRYNCQSRGTYIGHSRQ